ncbi:MAG: ABC transporter permease [Bifidobacteriaceae bacterium]|jgi:ribose transport system permease protein|nr:ABC transporter permease [Bifidobacteriaceae bacterium]
MRIKFNWVNLLRSQGLLIILICIVVYFSVASPFFLTPQNLLSIASASAALGVMAIPQTFLIISGGIDVSVGSVVCLSGVVVGLVAKGGGNVWVGVLLAICVGMACGLANGSLVVFLKVNPLIVTLGLMSVFTGLAYMTSQNLTLIVSDEGFRQIALANVGGFPVAVMVVLVLFGAAFFVGRATVVGRNIYAMGGNLTAARLVGIPTGRYSLVLYACSGLAAGIAGVFVTSQLGAASPQVGTTYMLSVVTAVILGGASLAGGVGTIWGTLIAVCILGSLQSGFTLLQLSSSTQTMAQGLALIVAVLLDQGVRAGKGGVA